MRKNALGYGGSYGGRTPRGAVDPPVAPPQEYMPPPPLLPSAITTEDAHSVPYRSRSGPRVRFAQDDASHFGTFTPPDASPVDHPWAGFLLPQQPKLVPNLTQLSRDERHMRRSGATGGRRSPSRRVHDWDGTASLSSSRTGSPLDEEWECREAGKLPDPDPYCRTDGETIRWAALSFRNGSKDSVAAAPSCSEAVRPCELHSTKVRPISGCIKGLCEEPFVLQAEARGRRRAAAVDVGSKASSDSSRGRVSSRSPIRISPNRFATELRVSLSKSPTRPSQTTSKPSARSSSASSPPDSAKTTTSFAADKSKLATPPRMGVSGISQHPREPAEKSAEDPALQPTMCCESAPGHVCPLTAHSSPPATKMTGRPTITEVMTVYRQKLEALKQAHRRNMALIQQNTTERGKADVPCRKVNI